MSSNFGFQPTLSGLNTIESDSTTSSNIVCDTIQINSSGTAPTMTTIDNSTHIATTAFVQNVISGAGANYVTLNTTQTITGQKTFTNANTYFTGNIVNDTYVTSASSSTLNIANNQVSGILNIGTNSSRNISSSVNLGSSSSPATTNIGGSIINVNAGSNININSSATGGNYNIGTSGSTTGTISIGTAQTTGQINIGTNAGHSGAINIGASGTTNPVFINNIRFRSGEIGSATGLAINSTISGNIDIGNTQQAGSLNIGTNATRTTGSINIGSTATTSDMNLNCGGNLTVNGNTSFTNIPSCSVVPTTVNDLTNKSYVDSAVSGGLTGYVDISNAQTITGAKLFNAFAVNQTTGNIDLTLNSNTQRHKLIRGTNSFETYFVGGTNYSVVMSSTLATANLQILAGANTMGITMSPAGGLGEGPEIDIQGIAFFPGNVWIDGTNAGMKSFGATNIRYYNPIAPLYLPSSLTSASLGYQYQLTSTTTPTLGANINVTFTSTGLNYFTLTAGVWLCEAYSGWAQASNNRAVSISATSATPDTQRACYSTQQNASFQELTLTTAITVSSSTNLYFIVTSGSNSGGFSSVTHTLRVTRIA